MSLDPATKERIEQLVSSDRVVLFMKGSRSFPQCGFSATVVQILEQYVPGGYKTVNVLSDPTIRQGIKDFSDWPTIPQLYVDGEFLGGCDIVRDMHEGGELAQSLGAAAEVDPPTITVTDEAAAALREALTEGGDVVHVAVNEHWQHDLYLDPPGDGEFQLESNGIKMSVAKAMARKLDGLVIRHEEGDQGAGFRLDNPNAPAQVTPISAKELAAKLEAGEALKLFDVRTPQERDTARIEGSVLLDQAMLGEALELDRDTVLVFQCHHGQRSRAAAEHFVQQGFKRVFNLTGGIDAWSNDVDPNVPKY